MLKTEFFKQSPFVEVRRIKGKGYGKANRGVFALADIEPGQVIEEVPVIRMPNSEVWGSKKLAIISWYCFAWHDDDKIDEDGFTALALGYGSLYNHSNEPNAEFEYINEDALRFVALRQINSGEEITIHYYQFDRSKVTFPKKSIPQ